MKIHTIRLRPKQDLKHEIEKFVEDNNIKAGFVITCVAGLEKAVLRIAGATPNKQDVRIFDGPLELTSLVGTVSVNGMHLHVSVSDKSGKNFGGHLKDGTIVNPTAEIVIGEDADCEYARELDPKTGFNELTVKYHKATF